MPAFWRLTEPSCRSLPSCGLRSKLEAPGFLRTGQPSTSYFSEPTAHSARSGAEAPANCYCLTPGPSRPLTPAEARSDGQGCTSKPEGRVYKAICEPRIMRSRFALYKLRPTTTFDQAKSVPLGIET